MERLPGGELMERLPGGELMERLPGGELMERLPGGELMEQFLAAAFTMPTAIFSVLLGLVILYWLTVVFGLFDLGIFEGLFEGSVEGTVEGMAEGMVEGAAEGMVEGVAEGMAEGAAEGVAEGAADGSTDAVLAGRPGCLGLFAIGEVPISISGTLLLIFAWLFSFGGTALLATIGVGGTVAATGLGVVALALSVGVTSLATRPLRKLFRMAPVTVRRDLVKRICKLTTLHVNEKFGQAEVDDEGAVLLVQVRCRRENDMTRGDRAIIYEYDAGREVFWIAPLDKDLSETYKTHGAKALQDKPRVACIRGEEKA